MKTKQRIVVEYDPDFVQAFKVHIKKQGRTMRGAIMVLIQNELNRVKNGRVE